MRGVPGRRSPFLSRAAVQTPEVFASPVTLPGRVLTYLQPGPLAAMHCEPGVRATLDVGCAPMITLATAYKKGNKPPLYGQSIEKMEGKALIQQLSEAQQ